MVEMGWKGKRGEEELKVIVDKWGKEGGGRTKIDIQVYPKFPCYILRTGKHCLVGLLYSYNTLIIIPLREKKGGERRERRAREKREGERYKFK